jgi:hypothetical protein
MTKGSAVFALSFVLIAPQARRFLAGVMTRTVDNLNAWAPFSYLAVLLLLAAPVVSVVVVRNWPQKTEPENPMAKYRREMVSDED